MSSVGRLALAGVVLYAGRQYFRNWGATKEETQMVLPGDELIEEPAVQTTEAEWINAPAARVWPWLLQLGQDRGGLYSYNLLENLVGLHIRNADGMHPRMGAACAGRLGATGADGLDGPSCRCDDDRGGSGTREVARAEGQPSAVERG